MRDLVGEQTQHLLANRLGDETALGLVGRDVAGKEPQTLGEKFFSLTEHLIDTLSAHCGGRNDCVELELLAVRSYRLGDADRIRAVGLVDNEDYRRAGCAQAAQNVALDIAHSRFRLDDDNCAVGLSDGVLDRADHVFAELCSRSVHAGCVDKNELILAARENAGYAVSRRLRL